MKPHSTHFENNSTAIMHPLHVEIVWIEADKDICLLYDFPVEQILYFVPICWIVSEIPKKIL